LHQEQAWNLERPFDQEQTVSWRRSFACSGIGQEATDIWRLPCFLQQETVVAVWRFDHVALDRLA
jgi:hypothetical protein